MVHMQHQVRQADCVYGGFEKGNKAEFEHLAKGLSFFDHDADRVVHYCVDDDANGSSTDEVALAID